MSEFISGRDMGINRYPSNAAALPMPAGAKAAGERNDRAMKRAQKAGEAFGLLCRLIRAEDRGDYRLVGVLIEEARGLVAETGGAA